MICFLGKNLGSTYIYNKSSIYEHVTIINIYNSYIFKSFNFIKKFYFIISYYNHYFKKFNFKKQFKVGYYDYILFNIKDKIPLNIFYINQKVKIYSISIGKGFSGVIKKYNFSSNYSSHGNSKAHNKIGSIGMCQSPGRVLPGKKMAGRYGGKKKFISGLKIKNIDFLNNILYLSGSVPGYKNSNILITSFNEF